MKILAISSQVNTKLHLLNKKQILMSQNTEKYPKNGNSQNNAKQLFFFFKLKYIDVYMFLKDSFAKQKNRCTFASSK